MPPWLRRQLGSGLLTPQAKAEAAPGETADARPTKAEVGLKLKIEEAISKGPKRVLVSLDLKNATTCPWQHLR